MKGQVEWPSEKEKLHQLHKSAQGNYNSIHLENKYCKGEETSKTENMNNSSAQEHWHYREVISSKAFNLTLFEAGSPAADASSFFFWIMPNIAALSS